MSRLSLVVLSLASTLLAAQVQVQVPFTAPTNCFAASSVSASIDLTGALTRTTTTFTLEQRSQCPTWLVGVQGQEGFVEAWESTAGGARTEIALTRAGRDADSHTTYYSLTPSSKSPVIAFASVLSHQSTPLPASLPQTAEAVSLLWQGDLLAPVAYLSADERAKISEYKVRVKTPSPRILSVKGPDGFETVHSKGQAGATFLAKSVADLGPQVASVHYIQPEAVASFRKLERLIEVSHWGSNLAVMDSIDLFNAGPKLSGHFARIDHQKLAMQRRTSALAITGLTFALPPHATSPYFYDIVGNVSTSNFRPSAQAGFELPSQKRNKKKAGKGATTSTLEIKPRYPLLGGWNYTFTIGYDAPLADFLKTRKDGSYVLAVPFLTPINDIAVDDVTVEIRLPEAARNIKVTLPFAVDSLSYPIESPALWGPSEGYTQTYLDSTGRPTIKISRKDCGDRHGGLVLIEYTANSLLDLLQKPVAIATFFSTLVLAIVGAKRIEWGIGK